MVDLFSGFLYGVDIFGELPEKPLLHIWGKHRKKKHQCGIRDCVFSTLQIAIRTA